MVGWTLLSRNACLKCSIIRAPRSLQKLFGLQKVRIIRVSQNPLIWLIVPRIAAIDLTVCSCTKKLKGLPRNIVEHLKKGAPGKFAKTIFYLLRSDNYSNFIVKVSCKGYNLTNVWKVPCNLYFIG